VFLLPVNFYYFWQQVILNLKIKMDTSSEPVYSRNVVEFVAVANEFCKYAEHASELKGDELLKILQRILPLMYLKASLLPQLDPFFEEGNEKFVTEADWTVINDTLKGKFGTANDFLEVFDEKINETVGPVVASISENMADIYQDLKDFLGIYQLGVEELSNDAIFECRQSFENYWGFRLVNSIRILHQLHYHQNRENIQEFTAKNTNRDIENWFINRAQRDFRANA
jgi:hypothetical protein